MDRLREVTEKYNELCGNVNRMLSDIQKCEDNREEVLRVNFSDHKFVG